MTFADIPAGCDLFVDANTFVYHFAPDPTWGAACTTLLQRMRRKEVKGFTSTHILSEVAHRMTGIEATIQFNWPIAGIATGSRVMQRRYNSCDAFVKRSKTSRFTE